LYLAAFRFYRDAFAEEPAQAKDLDHQHRYNAACAAALAGCGQGKDADQTDAKERARLRRQALDWLRADLAAYRQALDTQPYKVQPAVLQRMQHWQQDKDFFGVRGAEALAKLPPDEGKEWRVTWLEVETLRKRAAGVAETAPAQPELVPPPKEAKAGEEMSFDFVDRPTRVARHETLLLAVHEQVQDFQYRRADQCRFALGFDDCREGMVAAQQFDVDILGHVSLPAPSIGVADLDLLAERHAQLFHDGLGQHQRHRAGIDDAGNGLSSHLVPRQRPVFGSDDVTKISYLEFDAESPHTVGSFGSHAGLPSPRLGADRRIIRAGNAEEQHDGGTGMLNHEGTATWSGSA
ncbi:MAG TPA: hypothetical protein VKE94_09310, partial [Gemmataceae bacterium]|nr:hypothetical protein [Gemmataceae bacterium]